MLYVHRHNGKIHGFVEDHPMEGYAEEAMAESNPEFVAYQAEVETAQKEGRGIWQTGPEAYILSRPQFAEFLDEANIPQAQLRTAVDTAYANKPAKKRRQIKHFLLDGERYRYDDPVTVKVLTATGIDKATLDAAWLAAKDITYDA